MEQHTLDFFKDELLKIKRELLAEAYKTVNQELKSFKEDVSDTIDRSSLDSDRDFLLRLRDRDRRLIKKIDDAIQRIEDNRFGLCESCGTEIGVERLKARPVATLCIQCKEMQEERERFL